MNNHILLAALRARYRVLLLILGLTVAVTAVVSLLLPRTYVARAAMLVDNKTEQSMSSGGDGHVRERVGYMQTQVDIITSRKVALRVVDDLALTTRPEARVLLEEAFEGPDALAERLADALLKRIRIDTSQSSVIHIEFRSASPQFAATVANAFARAYMDTALELRVGPSRQTAEWFDEQIKTLRENLEEAQARLADYQRAAGIVTAEERLDAEGLVAAGPPSGAAGGERPLRSAGAPREDAQAARRQQLRGELQRAEARLGELALGLGDNHPAFRKQQAEVDHLREELARIAAPPVPSVARVVETRPAPVAPQNRVAELRQYRQRVAVLTREVEISQRAYETALQRALDKKVESRASLTNLSVLAPATAPFRPARPRLLVNLALSGVIGTLLGLGAIYLMERFDRRVRSAVDLVNEWNIPLLVELRAAPADAGRRLAAPAGPSQALPHPG
jgi:chain length determinant protein EpsF